MSKRSTAHAKADERTPGVSAGERSLPHNLEAERSVLGAIIVHNDAYEVAAEILRPGDFHRDAHRRIYAALMRLREERRIVADLVTLKEELARVGHLDEVGGPAYVASLADGMARTTNVKYYAQIVHEKAVLRAIIYAANTALAAAYEAEDSADAILNATDRALLELRNGRAGGLVAFEGRMTDIFRGLEHRIEHKGELRGVDTGFPSLNALTLGWRRGDLIIIGARPSIGKTSFAMNSAVLAARAHGTRVAVFSLEMRREQLEDRLLSSIAQIPFQRIQSGHIGGDEWSRLGETLEAIRALPVHIDDRSGRSVTEIRAMCRRLKHEHGLGLVVIDYVQLMAGELDRRGATRNDEITHISRRLKDLADELSVPILLLSQLSRSPSKRYDPAPTLSDLRDSGALEQDADVVGLLHRRNYREGGTTVFILAKQRNGPTGTQNLTIDLDTMTFTDGGEDPPAPDQPPARKPRGRQYRQRSFTGEPDETS